MIEVATMLQLLNVLIVPALVYVVRIDRRMAQIDVLTQENGARLGKIEDRVRALEIRQGV